MSAELPLRRRLEEEIGRPLTETEFSAAESMGSEHASYASTRPHLKELPINGFNLIKGVGDEAAAVPVAKHPLTGEAITIVFSSETHNSPSFVCAHPGSATGTGGNERDNIALTANLPILLGEARRQGHPLSNPNNDPLLQHFIETTQGIGDYGNAMGIPHGWGSHKFHPEFAGNNLVNVLALSVAPSSRLLSNQVPTTDNPNKFLGIYIGKASDTTGIGGTKFASQAIDMTDFALNEKAVQDPDPHLQYNVTRGIEKVIDRALREGWVDKLSLKDMGAAGLLCSSVEQLHGGIGVELWGDTVPMSGSRSSMELLEAETQERFFMYVHEDYVQEVLEIFNEVIDLDNINKGSCARVVGKCNDSGLYTFTRTGEEKFELPVTALTEFPTINREYKARGVRGKAIPREKKISLDQEVRKVLGSSNFRSDEAIHIHYDQHVQGTKIRGRGEAAATLRTTKELADLSIGFSFYFDASATLGLIDPKLQAVDSFLRGAYAMALQGCSVTSVTNNANYGRTDVPEEMWEFVEGQKGIKEVCENWPLEQQYLETILEIDEVQKRAERDKRRHVTVGSGNCSMNKANKATNTAIPPTTILGTIGWTNSPQTSTTWDLDPEGGNIYLIGGRSNRLGASDYVQSIHGFGTIGREAPEVDYERATAEVQSIIDLVRAGIVTHGNTIEEGGLCNALSEMIAQSEEGICVQLNLDQTMSKQRNLGERSKLFSEDHGVLVQVKDEDKAEFERILGERRIQAYQVGIVERRSDSDKSYDFSGLIINRKEHPFFFSGDEIRRKYHKKTEMLFERQGGVTV